MIPQILKKLQSGLPYSLQIWTISVEKWWHMVTHGRGSEGEIGEVGSHTLHTTSEHGVSNITTADVHTLAASSRLNWRPLGDLNGLVSFAERRNLVS